MDGQPLSGYTKFAIHSNQKEWENESKNIHPH